MKNYVSCKTFILILLIWLFPSTTKAYSVLTHEAIVDANWDKVILPLLKSKYPLATAEELKAAHAYVYGGAVAPDMGYYPFGSKLFTNLVHYVRTGDFVEALLEEAQNLNEYAFALGCLCHYNADVYGHRMGVNVSVPFEYPKVRKKYGNIVTYAEDKKSHTQMEFAFDVIQTARGNYASQAYHDFIGFELSKPVLERAFLKTYGLDINELFGNFERAVRTFRWAVGSLIPEVTRAAWVTKKTDIAKTEPTASAKKFIYHMHRVNYNHTYGKDYQKPGVFARFLSGVIKLLPKLGPFAALKFRDPGPVTERLYIASFDSVVQHYSTSLQWLQLHSGSHPVFLDKDFDTGKKTEEGEYPLADETYEQLLLKLNENNFKRVTPLLRNNILTFYSNNSDTLVWKDQNARKKTEDALTALRVVKL